MNVRVSCAVDEWKIVTALRACWEALSEMVLEVIVGNWGRCMKTVGGIGGVIYHPESRV